MTKEELLNKAIRDYPIGTKVKSIYSSSYNGAIVSYDSGVKPTTKQIWFRGENSYNYLIYQDGVWAKIISYPDNYKQSKYYFY